MANEFIYQTSDVITSFSTKHPRALIARIPWVITPETRITEAMNLLFEDGHTDLVVLDPSSGAVIGLLSNFETTTTLSSKKKKEKKAEEMLGLQGQCHLDCEAQCADRGGCANHGIADYGRDGGIICTIICKDSTGDDTVGGILTTLPG